MIGTPKGFTKVLVNRYVFIKAFIHIKYYHIVCMRIIWLSRNKIKQRMFPGFSSGISAQLNE